ncbi:hypothetical protein [Mesorhizobium sp.]|uniref:hypothetical protein n=1 Tax=Mesorhizobium sp. TaxID=1871066 RepID=UPI000FE8FF72|nr:hypothetical protein [Mesorhizobium sp.]RWP37984.1 MAG: hypothetical protein EOR03_03520 [Mesorhizobium sp.]
MIKRAALWTAIIVAGLIGYAAKHAYGMSDQAIYLAVTAIGLVIVSFHFDRRMAALEERVIHKDYSGIKVAIQDGERHKPQHEPPKSLIDGGAVQSFITAAHEVLFEDFRWFGAVLNQHVAEAWAIEELNDTDVRGIEGPEVGRRYQVYYNACKMGTMQVTVGGHEWIFRPETFAENRQAQVEIDLDYLRFVPFDAAESLISSIVLFIGPFRDDGEGARSKAASVAAAALTGHLWESVRSPDVDMSFEFGTEGPYELLRNTTDHWKANGIDPLLKWAGDRP